MYRIRPDRVIAALKCFPLFLLTNLNEFNDRDLANVRCRSDPPCPLFLDEFLLAQQQERRRAILRHRPIIAALPPALANPVQDLGLPLDVDLQELARNLLGADAEILRVREEGRQQHIEEIERREAQARRRSAARSRDRNLSTLDWMNDGCKFLSSQDQSENELQLNFVRLN